MKLTKIIVLAACLLLYPKEVYAGDVTVDPSADSDKRVYAAKDQTVTFTATADIEDSVDISDSTFTNGSASFSTGASTGTATVTFSSAALGQNNSCKIKVTSKYTPLNETCSTDKEIDFNVTVPKITPECLWAAPTDSNSARTNLGPGEQTKLTVTPADVTQDISWDIVDGVGTVDPTGSVVKYTAPNEADSEVVEATFPNNIAVDISFDILAPSGESASGFVDSSAYSPGTEGVSMTTSTIVLLPTNVNFYALETQEEDCGASSADGSFADGTYTPPTSHNPSGWWDVFPTGNSEAGDIAASHGWPSPWKPGSFTFDITCDWQVKGSGEINSTDIPHRTQIFSIDDSTGHSTITKFGNPISRTP